MASLRHARAPFRSVLAARLRVAILSLGLFALASGCSSSHGADGKSLKQLGIDDDAAEGESTSVRVDVDEKVELVLPTGAVLYVPKGSVEKTTRVGLRRVEDKEALEYLARLDEDAAILSAPYAVMPYAGFEAPVDLLLPIATRSRSVRVGILMLEDESDKRWRLIGEAEIVEDGLAAISIEEGGIYLAVDLDRLDEDDFPPPDVVVRIDAAAPLDAGERDAGGRDAEVAMDARVRDAQSLGPDVPTIPDPIDPTGPATKVDLLFMIDNSGTMSEEQKKLASVLTNVVRVLTTGNKSGQPSPSGVKPDFTPAESLHIGVVSSDMGVAGAQPQKSCGALSFVPTERNTASTQEFLNKPLGDDGILQTSTAVAQSGIFVAASPGGTPVEVVPGDPSCASVTFPSGERYIDYRAGVSNPDATAKAFGCIAKLGKNGCGLEQQLESALKALTPPDSQLKFTMNSNGHGTATNPFGVSGVNAKFLRDDAVLAIVFLSDEEDCSLPDASNALFDATSSLVPGEINVRCGLPENQRYLHDVASRYIAGFKALKPAAYQDRIIVTSIVGIPVGQQLGGKITHSGVADIDAILARPDMQFMVRRNSAGTSDEPVPTCISGGGHGSAAPARRFLELTKAFGDNGIVTSICEDQYEFVLQVLVDRIAARLR